MPSLLLRRAASASAIRRSSSARTLASARALARALRSSSVNVRSTTPELVRGAAGVAGRASGALAAGVLATAGSAAAAGSAAGASPPIRRLPRFSTTTCLVRPWLKLWRTVPCSTRLSVKVLLGLTLRVLSPGFFVSTIQQSQSCCAVRVRTGRVVRNLAVFSCLAAARHPGIGPGSGCATGTSCSPGPRAGLHVSHLTGPVPNPILPTPAR